LPVISESKELKPAILSAIDYCEQEQKQIENARSQATNSLYELLFKEPPVSLRQLVNPAYREFVSTINKLDSNEKIENFQKEMTKVINEQKQQLQPQFQAQIVQREGGNK